jgi:hypothetical protein
MTFYEVSGGGQSWKARRTGTELALVQHCVCPSGVRAVGGVGPRTPSAVLAAVRTLARTAQPLRGGPATVPAAHVVRVVDCPTQLTAQAALRADEQLRGPATSPAADRPSRSSRRPGGARGRALSGVPARPRLAEPPFPAATPDTPAPPRSPTRWCRAPEAGADEGVGGGGADRRSGIRVRRGCCPARRSARRSGNPVRPVIRQIRASRSTEPSKDFHGAAPGPAPWSPVPWVGPPSRTSSAGSRRRRTVPLRADGGVTRATRAGRAGILGPEPDRGTGGAPGRLG